LKDENLFSSFLLSKDFRVQKKLLKVFKEIIGYEKEIEEIKQDLIL
jgi:hypothetical protein